MEVVHLASMMLARIKNRSFACENKNQKFLLARKKNRNFCLREKKTEVYACEKKNQKFCENPKILYNYFGKINYL